MIKYDKLWITLKQKHISQYKLVEYYGVDRAQLQRLRKNEIVKTLIINSLCNILNCRVEDIMEYVPDDKVSNS
ncbi:MAG: helix-turn-helix transcriptional regulator [Lachnospiraceae bacterium]